ncbi:unannotated protein [freshwater metagenome]|uniref:Unannotated protein n=1 Tax=freshwater metagenome TaxID=449393 RepID=A0A6J7L7J3_9ZZZZ
MGIEVETVGTTSLTTRERVILPSGEVAAEARVVMVQWDVASHSPRAFTAEERAALEASRGLTGV